MSPATFRRRLLLLSLVSICAVAMVASMLAGCATNDQGWEMQPSHAPLPAYFVDSTPAQIAQACHRATGTVAGCAVRHYDLNRCFIYIEANAPHWLATHELEHCAGFNHPQ